MTMKNPASEQSPVLKWIKGVNPQSIVLCTVALMTGWATMGTRITVVEQNVPGLMAQVAANKAQMDQLSKDYVDRQQYNIDMQNIHVSLAAIQASNESILKILAEGRIGH